MVADCVFCRIVSGDIPSERLLEDKRCIVIRDIHPQAPQHLLVVTKAHIPTAADVREEKLPLLGHLVMAATKAAEQVGIAKTGYRLVINNGPDSGQEVPHLHLHVLGGAKLGRLG